jgi:hypothetical protein
VLIVASGSIGDLDGRPVDILGLGLKGTAGLVRYLPLLAVLLGITLAAVPLAARSWRDRGIVRRLAAWLPGIGPALVAAEAAAWCRAAAMAGHAGLNAGRLVELAAGAAPGLRISAAEIESRLRAGDTLDAALAASGRLPKRVIEAVEVGELTGTTPETLDRLVPQLEDEARAGLAAAVKGNTGKQGQAPTAAQPEPVPRTTRHGSGKQGQAPTAAQPEPVPRTTPPELPGRNSWPGWGRSFRSSARTVAATSG